MRKHLTKLIAALMLLVISLGVAGIGTYAWLVLSTAPEIGGMQVSIGGSNTILVAPDIAESTAGGTVHYPGAFSQTMNLTDHLKSLRGLLPVSTADGLHWYIPAYDTLEEGAQLKGISEFTMDDTLACGNQGAEETANGSYLYFDFWVVAPSNQTLRVSTSTSQLDSAGTFVLVKPAAVSDGNGGYTLDTSNTQAAAAIRLGFLANEEPAAEAALTAYLGSEAYDETYQTLKGVYQNKGQPIRENEAARFTIFEPNGDYHPGSFGDNGSYLITQPLGLSEGAPQPADVSKSLTVQRASVWAQEQDGNTKLNEMLAAAVLQAQNSGVPIENGEAAIAYLFDKYLQNQLMGYVTTGSIITSTHDLYQAAESGSVSADKLEPMNAGATQDVYIVKLEANVPQRIRMFLWLEGQDVDCTEGVQGSELIINLELAGETGS